MTFDVPKLERVLCALDVDGSTQGPLAAASLMAYGFQASLDALYAPLPVPAFSGRVERVRRLIAEHGASERLSALLSPFTHSFRAAPYVTRGQASQVILDHSVRYGSDLIVMGSSSAARLGKRTGRVSAPVASAADCAVLTIARRSAECSLRRVLVPVYSPAEAGTALAWASSIARRFDAEVQLIALSRPRTGLWSAWKRTERADAHLRHERRLRMGVQAALAQLRDARVKSRVRRLANGEQAELVELARCGEFDLVVISTRPGAPETSEGRNLARVLRAETDVSVLSVPMADIDTAQAPGRQPRAGLIPSRIALSA